MSGSKSKKPKRDFHHKAKPVRPTADEDAVARMVATIFTAAAGRVLRDKYNWTEEATVTFGDELVEEAMTLANALNERGRALETMQAGATSGYAQAQDATSDGPTAVTMPVTVPTVDEPDVTAASSVPAEGA